MAEIVSPTTEKKEYVGGCHCGFIRYKVKLAISDPPTATRCNCTVCTKTSFHNVGNGVSESDFTLLKPEDTSQMSNYQYRITTVDKFFCPKCGVHVYGKGTYIMSNGEKYNHFAVSLATLDQPQEGLDLSKFRFKYCDGFNDNWYAEQKDHPYPNGLL